MPRVITTLQAMSHPTVVATINCLSEMTQRLQDENDELKAALAQPEERNFCPRCGKRTADLTTVHTCTPPQDAR
jgi:hypothetical protein